ncbi:alkaline phosphatase PafA [Mangrovimonas futianensis]|uniref:alkaline phosphatase PafA n=1 Tax=Mangrovimonas futianensis TaxID=2895523 RepID=UPI001E5824D9|nr:alkaline phosphatase PafA [Mangrovimonas futianensis]MCF1422498.1 alkaline phosphatase family protein [Mangrovimonas futianensis]
MKKFLVFVLISISCANLFAQKSKKATPENGSDWNRPKLVVGIVVDQMRYDYLTRFYNKYGNDGFKRLMNQGFDCRNNHFNYIPTYTGPGHASVYTGTTPKYHGIIGNNWYDKEIKETIYCAGDEGVSPVGTDSPSGKMSPHRLMTTTFGDENRMFTQFKGKTIGVALKDRGAILPAGHTANAAYWFHGSDEGRWITSSFYMKELPQWVIDFNKSGNSASYMKTWDTYYNIDTYVESGLDLNEFEGGFKGKETATFPYDLNAIKEKNGYFDILKTTPYGNSMTADFAIAALDGEQLGQDKITDVLTVSFSSTDYVGHNFGVNSKEIEDTYIRLDLDLARLFKALDDKVGEGEYTVFLTADHGAVEVPAYLHSVKIPSGYLNNSDSKKKFDAFMKKDFGHDDLVENISNNQVFLNREKIKELGLDLDDVQDAIVEELLSYENVYKAYTAQTMASTSFTTGVEELLENGFNQKRSGDVLVVQDPAFISYGRTGSTHGSGFNYDTHVPLLFYGKGIKQGHTFERTVIPDIASTISSLLGVSFPSGATGRPLGFLLK